MKIVDLDSETKALIVSAHHLVAFPSEAATERLRLALEKFDKRHSEEREANLLNALGPAASAMKRDQPDKLKFWMEHVDRSKLSPELWEKFKQYSGELK